MPKVSIIIPVYNAQIYLNRCLDSICNQTLKDIEIICINDCSTDNSLKILNEYANKDQRIQIINYTQNRGESAARNAGLNIASGEYLGFVDNDDTVDIDFYEKLYSQAYKTSADIVKGEAHIFDYSGRDYFDNLNKAIRENNSKLFFHNYWWTAIYKTLLIKNNNIKFLEGYPLGGDVLFLNQVILLANNISLVDNIYYNYYRREESGDSKVLSLDKIKSVLEIHLKIIENTNKYITSINKIGVLNIYKWCLECGLNYAYRRKTFENLEYCINRTFDMYDKCIFKNELYNILKINYPIESNFIKNGKKNELIDYFKKYNTPQKKILATLRKSHNKVLKYE